MHILLGQTGHFPPIFPPNATLYNMSIPTIRDEYEFLYYEGHR